MSRHRCALVLTHNRHDLLDQCLGELRPQVEDIVVIDNASNPPVRIPKEWKPAAKPVDGAKVRLFTDDEQPPNLARLWNRGLDFFEKTYQGNFDIAVLCDDAIIPAGWFDAVVTGMRETSAVIGCSDPWGAQHPPMVKTAPDNDIRNRMPGWAWIMDGQRIVRADERLRWWYLDTKIDFDARRAGGMVMIGGYPVVNVHPGGYTNSKPELGEQAGRDRATFQEIEGSLPW